MAEVKELEAQTAEPNIEPECHLLRLPRELRDHIWALALPDKVNFRTRKWCPHPKSVKSDHQCDDNQDAQPALSRTCSVIRNETLSIFYSNTILNLASMETDYREVDGYPGPRALLDMIVSTPESKLRMMKCVFYEVYNIALRYKDGGHDFDELNQRLIYDLEEYLQDWLT